MNLQATMALQKNFINIFFDKLPPVLVTPDDSWG